jgi:hypothetical protein
LNNFIIELGALVRTLKQTVKSQKEDIACLRFDHQLEQREMRKDFRIAVETKQKYNKKLQENMTDQMEMTCEMLDEVKVAKQAARLMSKKA